MTGNQRDYPGELAAARLKRRAEIYPCDGCGAAAGDMCMTAHGGQGVCKSRLANAAGRGAPQNGMP